MLDGFSGAPGLLAFDREARAAARDGDLERRLDLAQILVERPAQAGEALVVHGIEADLDGLRPHQAFTNSPRSVCASAEVTRTSANEPISSSPAGKLTTRLFAVRPLSSAAFFFETLSTSTRSLVPTMLSLIARACASSCVCSRASLSDFSCEVTPSGKLAAGVPGRGL